MEAVMSGVSFFGFFGFVIVPILVVLFSLIFLSQQYKRCPSNKILVVYGKVKGAKTAQCLHGGGQFVIPLIQDFTYLSLEPITIEIELKGALSKKNIRVNVPSTFTIGISTEEVVMHNAAERLLGLDDGAISHQAKDIILGQLRLVIATLAIEEINQDREKFLNLINQNVTTELHKIGLDLINVNIRDITDESGYIEAIGKKAAAEAINQAKVEVAEQSKYGAIGEETAIREQDISVADQKAQSVVGQRQANTEQAVKTAKLDAEASIGEEQAETQRMVQTAKLQTESQIGQKQAELEQRVKVAIFEADAIKGENKSKAQVANFNAELLKAEAEAKRLGETAEAAAARDVLRAEKEAEVAKLEKTELAQEEVDKRKVEIKAEAEAERQRRIARGEADAILARYEAEAEGIQKVLEAKAQGYHKLIESCAHQKDLAPTLLMVEKLPEIVKEQVQAIKNIEFGKITVWENGNGSKGDGESSTSNFLRSVASMLPPIHELAKQAGVDLPGYFGKLSEKDEKVSTLVEPDNT